MPKARSSWYQLKANRIMRAFRTVHQKELAQAINVSPQLMNYRIKNVYFDEICDLVRMLDLVGYEIREKGEEDD